jgi:hypothetical protein
LITLSFLSLLRSLFFLKSIPLFSSISKAILKKLVILA